MEHDPLCANTDDWETFTASDGHLSIGRKCYCDLIAKVRADERRIEAERRAKEFGVWHDVERDLP